MIRRGNHDPSQAAQRVRDEVAAARDQLLTAAEQGAQRVGDTSRRARKEAKERAVLAGKVLRGERPASPWRWLGIGLAAGVAVAAAGVAAFRRWREPATEAVREKAGPAVDTVRERTTAVAGKAAGAARDTVAKARDAARDVSKTAQDRAGDVTRAARNAGRDVSKQAGNQAEDLTKETQENAKEVAEEARRREPATSNSRRSGGTGSRQDPDPTGSAKGSSTK